MTELTPEKPAEGIMRTGDYGDSKFYKIDCRCGNPDDEIHFEVEADDNGININTWTQPKTEWWDRLVGENHTPRIQNPWLYSIDESFRSFINALSHRIIMTYRLWNDGYLKYSQTTIMSEQQALNYAHTLINAIDDVKQFKKERKHAQENSEGC